MSRQSLLAGSVICLLLGAVDLGLINVWLVPAAWPPGPVAERSADKRDRPVPREPARRRAVARTAPAPTPPAPQPARPEDHPPARTGERLPDPVTVFFKTSRHELTPAARRALKTNLPILKKDSGLLVVVEGHADQRGEETYNSRLSMKRAGAVVAFLARNGISSKRIRSRGWGSAR